MPTNLAHRSPEQLKALRLRHHVKRTHLARWAGLESHTIYCWETGRIPPPLYLERLLESYIQQHRPGGGSHAAP